MREFTQREQLSLIYLILSISFISSTHFGKIFPIGPLGYLLSLIIFGHLVLSAKLAGVTAVIHVSIVSAMYKLYQVLFPPSLIGIDPDGKALMVANMLRENTVSVIDTYYSSAPVFHLISGSTTLISDVMISTSFMIFPIIGGMIPIVAYSIGSLLPIKTDLDTGALAAVIVAATAVTGQFSIWPIPQLIAVFFWGIAVFVVLRPGMERWKRGFILVVLSVVLIFTHKIGLFAFVIPLGTYLVLNRVSYIRKQNVSSYKLSILVPLLLLILFIQYRYLSDFLNFAILKSTQIVIGILSSTESQTAASYRFAEPLLTGIQGIGILRIHWICLGIFGAIAWFTLVQQTNDDKRLLLVIFSTVLVGISSLGLVSSRAVLATRFLFFVEILVAVIAASILTTSSRRVMKTVLFLLLCSQVFAPVAVPDHSARPPHYLSEQEINAKEFGLDQIDSEIATDWFFEIKRPPSQIESARTSPVREQYQPMTTSILERDFESRDEEFMLIRNKRFYRFYGNYWRLLYNPFEEAGNINSKIYSSGKAGVFKR